jgi:hypothetical protein
MVQVIEHLHRKQKALSSNPQKGEGGKRRRKKRRKRRRRRRGRRISRWELLAVQGPLTCSGSWLGPGSSSPSLQLEFSPFLC